jgi:hypothetical protein
MARCGLGPPGELSTAGGPERGEVSRTAETGLKQSTQLGGNVCRVAQTQTAIYIDEMAKVYIYVCK